MQDPKQKQQANRLAKVVERNIEALLERRRREDASKSREEKIADAITRFTGSMVFVYIHLVVFGFWLLYNSGWFNVPMFDPSYVVLAMVASVEAIFLSTFVLISQNRMNVQAEKRAELDLQVSLLTEHEVTRIITMVSALSEKAGIEIQHEQEIEELSQDVHPEKVMDTMENFENRKKKD